MWFCNCNTGTTSCSCIRWIGVCGCFVLLLLHRTLAYVPNSTSLSSSQRSLLHSTLRSTTSSSVVRPSIHSKFTTIGTAVTTSSHFHITSGTTKTTSKLLSSTQLHSSKNPILSLSFAVPNKKDIQSILSVMIFIIIDITYRRLFRLLQIAFPSSLGACMTLLTSLLLVPQSIANIIYTILYPGATILAKWLPIFFVPSLITLPLADSCGTSIELIKIGCVILGGLFFTLLSTSYSVMFIRKMIQPQKQDISPNISSISTEKIIPSIDTTTKLSTTTTNPVKVISKTYSNEIFHFLCLSTIVTGVATLVSSMNGPMMSLFLLSSTLNAFVLGTRLPDRIKCIIHPLVSCATLTWVMMTLISSLCSTHNFWSILQLYKIGRLNGIASGAGDVLLFLLGPAVVSLAISMYEKRQLMKQNLVELITAISIASLGGLYGTAFTVRVLQIASPYIRLSLLSRSITSPLAMAIASIVGADISLAVSMTVVTGLLGANFGATILDVCHIKDPVARGLGIGAAAHGLGTAAFTNEQDAFPFAAISMALTASAATIAVSIPFIRKSLIQLALGV